VPEQEESSRAKAQAERRRFIFKLLAPSLICQSLGSVQVSTISAFSTPKAAFIAEGVLAAFPALSGVWLDMGRAKAQLGDLEAAKEALRRAFALDEELRLEAEKDERLSAVW
jgi:hypothetical protein